MQKTIRYVGGAAAGKVVPSLGLVFPHGQPVELDAAEADKLLAQAGWEEVRARKAPVHDPQEA